MGLRSFVALPIEKGGSILRLLGERNVDANVTVLNNTLAHGLSGTQTLFLGLPFRLSPSGGGDRVGDFGLLYRHIAWQVDTPNTTSRLGVLGGAVLPTDSGRDPRLRAGAVATFYRGRYEWDIDGLWVEGIGSARDSARYDLSWQYRLTPATYPEWGIGSEWDVVVEYGGRWRERESLTHQFTLGLQWIHKNWVLEGGVVQDVSTPHDTRFLLSTRVHF